MKHPVAIVIGAGLGLVGLGLWFGRRRAAGPTLPPEAEPASYQLIQDPGTMKPWAMTQSDVLQAVKDGRAQFAFVPLPGAPGVYVTTDAVKVDGVRVPVTARTTQAVADYLGVLPTTALVEDMIHAAAAIRVEPPTANPDAMQSDGVIRGYSVSIDNQVRASGLADVPAAIVSSVGKSWVLDNAELNVPGRAVNYGLIRADGPYESVTRQFKLWQQPGWKHNPDHWDYSQTLRLCRLDPGASLPSIGKLQVTRLWT